ncbi:TIGR02117 family protein [Sphingorhabdus sp.]|uniref:TIGR02117 family protein n=1 Tax=Sphingorhabdus sp. TaxID=1902408 RepID=UPI00391A6507
MKLFRINSVGSGLRAVLGWPLFLTGIYMCAALIGSVIPVNSVWQEPDDGITLFVETNGVHVSIIVPTVSEFADLTDIIRPNDLTDPKLNGTHAMIGWGHAGVYRNAPTWADIRPADIASAVLGSEHTLLHVYHLNNPQPQPHRATFKVSPDQYRLMVANIRSSFALTASGQSIAHRAYGPDNVFYEANGRYSAVHTCNEWTGSVLRNAGVKMGAWTPLPGGVMRWFRTRRK